MSPEMKSVDSGLILKAGIFWNCVIFRETRFFYSLNVKLTGAMRQRPVDRWDRRFFDKSQ